MPQCACNIPASDLLAMLDRIKRDGGFTYNPRTQRFVTGGGYVVANPPGGVSRTSSSGYAIGVRAILALSADSPLLDRPGFYLGAWKDDGRVYAEISQVFRSRAEALRVAADRGERAIYDLRNRRDIPVARVA